LVCSSQRNYFENATACSKRTLKTTVSSQLYKQLLRQYSFAKKLASQTVIREKLLKSTFVQKRH